MQQSAHKIGNMEKYATQPTFWINLFLAEFINARRSAYFEIQIKILFDSNVGKQKYVRDSFLCKKM